MKSDPFDQISYCPKCGMLMLSDEPMCGCPAETRNLTARDIARLECLQHETGLNRNRLYQEWDRRLANQERIPSPRLW